MTLLRSLSAISHLWLLPVVLALVCSIPYQASAAQWHGATVSAAPGYDTNEGAGTNLA
jgi:hypothetical protein